MLKAVALTKSYGDHLALNSLDLEIDKGAVFCLLGQNGAGKTTTINLFLGFIKPTSGSLYINDIEIQPNDVRSKSFVAYIPEIVMLYPQFTAVENLKYFSCLAGFSFDKCTLENFLSQAGLHTDVQYKRVSTYSKGMRQKVGIAIALAKNASVIFMDEPTSGLDPKATDDFTQIVKQLGAQGKTIFMATHDIFNAVNVATQIGIMKQGNLLHKIDNQDITANYLQELYLNTV